jgi:hypothetical protein
MMADDAGADLADVADQTGTQRVPLAWCVAAVQAWSFATFNESGRRYWVDSAAAGGARRAA